jgi:peptide/nickel transport system permease protein
MATETVSPTSVIEEIPRRPSILGTLAAFSKANPLGAIGGLIVIAMVIMAFFAPYLTSYDPTANDFGAMLTAPDAAHWLGTDQFGRDLLSRIIYGARTALLVGFVSSFIGCFLGLILGVASAYFGGIFDLLFQRFMDVLMAFPLIILALAVVAIFGTGVENVILAITLPVIPRAARVVRASALAIREMPYIDAARANGFSHSRIIFRHMMPNVMAPFLIILTAQVGQAILVEASLSFLGLGVQEPIPAWGLMLRGGAQDFAESAPWVAIFPGLAITLAVFAFNLFGDALRDWLDPKMKT